MPDEANLLVRRAGQLIAWKLATQVPHSELKAAVAHFVAERAAIELHIADAKIDNEGRIIAQRHVEAFFAAASRLDELVPN